MSNTQFGEWVFAPTLTADQQLQADTNTLVMALLTSGYLGVDNESRTVARLDTPDWEARMPHHLQNLPKRRDAECYYRRCLSGDRIRLPAYLYARIPHSMNCSEVGFRSMVPGTIDLLWDIMEGTEYTQQKVFHGSDRELTT